MAEINETTEIPSVGTGILAPQLQHRWRLTITNSVPLIEEAKELLRHQIVAVHFNYHLQILEMFIEQNVNNTQLHTLVKQLSKLSKINKYDDVAFVVECTDGNENVNGRFMFKGCKLIDHLFVLDYSVCDACGHTLKFSFKETKDLT